MYARSSAGICFVVFLTPNRSGVGGGGRILDVCGGDIHEVQVRMEPATSSPVA